MNFGVKLLVTNLVIVTAVQVGRKWPAAGGLIATMPLSTLLVLLWLHSEQPENYDLLTRYTRGVLWGIGPSLAFFAAALWCFHHRFPLPAVLATSFGLWLAGALLHTWFLR
ncbi:MAG: DUF3147 family protein [Deltaproteobacteria bacterium]|nr:DUF3147 family protein [Deltaproteobacteria bacterium]